MPAPTEAALTAALKTVIDPHTGRDFVSGKQLKNLRIDGDDVSFDIELGYPARSQHADFRKALVAAARSVGGVGNVSVNLTTKVTTHAAWGKTCPQSPKALLVLSSTGFLAS